MTGMLHSDVTVWQKEINIPVSCRSANPIFYFPILKDFFVKMVVISNFVRISSGREVKLLGLLKSQSCELMSLAIKMIVN